MKKFLIFPILMGVLIFSGCGKVEEGSNTNDLNGGQSGDIVEEVGEETVDESMVAWKTYQDESLGFSIAYPDGWVIARPKSLLTDAYWLSDSSADNSLKRVININPVSGPENYSYAINVYAKNEDVYKQKEAIIASVGNQFSESVRKEERSEITFNNSNATLFTVTVSNSTVNNWYSENIILEGDRYIYLIPVLENGKAGYFDKNIAYLKNIHETFKLLPESSRFDSDLDGSSVVDKLRMT